MAAVRIAVATAVALVLAGQAVAAAPQTVLSPSQALFGDRITAMVAVSPGVHVIADFGPLDVLSGPVRTRAGLTWTVACLSEDCVPGASPRRILLPPARIVGAAPARAAWPLLTIKSRVSRSEAAKTTPPFRLETQLPRPSYRVGPGGLALALGVLAVALALVAALLVARELALRRRLRVEARLAARSPLERALLYAREAERRGSAERRRAVGLLARVLGGRDERLSGAAAELAWSSQSPSPDQVESLVGDVERKVGPR
jgi:hypothetical protein